MEGEGAGAGGLMHVENWTSILSGGLCWLW